MKSSKAEHLLFFLLGLCMLLAGCPGSESGVASSKRQSDSLATSKPIQYDDRVYEDYIRTVRFFRSNDILSFPILFLDDPTTLTLEFDALQPASLMPEDYWIEVLSCDYDWRPCGLLPLEFMDGFSSDRMYSTRRSENTLIPYVHYQYEFPAQGSGFKRSGNYLIKVFRSGNENDLLLTRRLVVVGKKVAVEPLVGLSLMASDRRKMQRVDFNIHLQGLQRQMFDPRNDLQVMILQNFRWDNASTDLKPMFANEDKLEFQFDTRNQFQGGNEYRMLDIRSTRFRTQNIKSIDNPDSIYRVTMHADEPRLKNVYNARQDLNGNFLIGVQEYPHAAWEADYVLVRFILKYPDPITTGEVHVFGKFSDWRCSEQTKMDYNASSSRFEAELLLKQGVYDYAYVVKPKGASRPDEARLEGSHSETENYYTILAYFKPPGARCAELVGMRNVNFYDR